MKPIMEGDERQTNQMRIKQIQVTAWILESDQSIAVKETITVGK